MNRTGVPRDLSISAPARILSRLIDKPLSECWVWPGADNGVGYGVIGRGGKHGANVYVHRLVFEMANGPIPDGLVIDHLCRNRKCCNPTHMEPVTTRENLLRGEGPSARAAVVTHCPQGHAYDEANTYRLDGARKCRACARQWQRDRRAQKKASLL